jgi:hypothetical protein
MRKNLYKHLKSAFDKSLRQAFPSAALLPKKEQPAMQGVIYAVERIGKRHAIVMLQASDLEQTFTIECALAKTSCFPWHADSDLSEGTREPVPCFPVRIRLGHTYPPFKDQWWPTTSIVSPPLDCSQAELMRFLMLESSDRDFPPDRVEESVHDAIDKIVQHCMPFLRRCAEGD